MKIIPLTEAKAHLSEYGKQCQEEPIIVTVNGFPAFQLAPIPEDDDDLIDELLEHNPEFRALLNARASERSLSSKDAADSL
jgi:prevent-host-death family protein